MVRQLTSAVSQGVADILAFSCCLGGGVVVYEKVPMWCCLVTIQHRSFSIIVREGSAACLSFVLFCEINENVQKYIL